MVEHEGKKLGNGKWIDMLRQWGRKLLHDADYPHRDKLRDKYFGSKPMMKLFLEVSGISSQLSDGSVTFESFTLIVSQRIEQGPLPTVNELIELHRQRKAGEQVEQDSVEDALEFEPTDITPALDPEFSPNPPSQGEPMSNDPTPVDTPKPKPKRLRGWLKVWHSDNHNDPYGYVGVKDSNRGPDFRVADLSPKVREAFEHVLATRKPDAKGRVWLDRPSIFVSFVLDETGRDARDIRLDTRRMRSQSAPALPPQPAVTVSAATQASQPPTADPALLADTLKQELETFKALLSQSGKPAASDTATILAGFDRLERLIAEQSKADSSRYGALSQGLSEVRQLLKAEVLALRDEVAKLGLSDQVCNRLDQLDGLIQGLGGDIARALGEIPDAVAAKLPTPAAPRPQAQGDSASFWVHFWIAFASVISVAALAVAWLT